MGYKVRVLPAAWRSSLAMIYVDKLGMHIAGQCDLLDCSSYDAAQHKIQSILSEIKKSVMEHEISEQAIDT